MPFIIFTMTGFTYFINFSIILKYFETPFWKEPSRLVYKTTWEKQLCYFLSSHMVYPQLIKTT